MRSQSIRLLLVSFIAIGVSLRLGFALSQFSDSANVLDGAVLGVGTWIPETPENLGWNVQSQSASPNEDPLDLACNPGGTVYVNENSVAHNWSQVLPTDQGHTIRYIRENIRPNGSHITLPGSGSYADTYTGWGGFGMGEGEYQTRVKAFSDTNSNGSLDTGEYESDWSEYCSITYDQSNPLHSGLPDFTFTNGDSFSFSEIIAEDDNPVELYIEMPEKNGESFSVSAELGTEGASNQWLWDTLNEQLSGTVAMTADTYPINYYFVDAAGNRSADFSFDLIIEDPDTTAPSSTLTVTNSPVKDVEERISNGGFETGDFNSWIVEDGGDAAVLGSDSVDGETVSPYAGDYMARIGVTEDPGQDVEYNILSQEIPEGVRSVGFYYNFFTRDYMGFDEPGMMVFVDDKQVQQIWAGDLPEDGSDYRSTGWRHMNVYLPDASGSTLTIAFYAGNTDVDLADPIDGELQSWLYLDEVSTTDLITSSSALFTIDGTDDNSASGSLTHYHKLEGEDAVAGESFTVANPYEGQVQYWSVDEAGNAEDAQSFYLIIDDEAPSTIVDLSVSEIAGGDYELEFTAASDALFDTVSEYDIRYSTSEITTASDWNSLLVPDRLADDSYPGSVRAPRMPGESEFVTLTGLLEGQEYYFAIKSADAAKNWSDMSNVAVVNEGASTKAEIVINEFIPNPLGADDAAMPAGEWVELYNTTAADIDVDGWVLYDSHDDHALPISASNSDNNLNLTDSGETVVPAGGRLVVYRDGDSDFSLNNDADTVRLFDDYIGSGGSLIDSYSYTGSSENKTYARVPDGSDNWIDPIPTPLRINAEHLEDLVPTVVLAQSDTYSADLYLFDSQAYESAEYSLVYSHTAEDKQLRAAIQGSLDINNQSTIHVPGLYLATCSEAGEVCVPHLGISDLSVAVELLAAEGQRKTVLYNYDEIWNEGESE